MSGTVVAGDSRQNIVCFDSCAVFHEPSWTFRDRESGCEEHESGDGSDTEHPAPSNLAIPRGQHFLSCEVERHGTGDEPVGNLCGQHAKHDCDLVQRNESTANACWSDLRDVHRRECGCQSYGSAPEYSPKNEHIKS